jgi:hypothetical protein
MPRVRGHDINELVPRRHEGLRDGDALDNDEEGQRLRGGRQVG